MPVVVIGRTVEKAPWGDDWLGGLMSDVAVRTGAWPCTLAALYRGMVPDEVSRLTRWKSAHQVRFGR